MTAPEDKTAERLLFFSKVTITLSLIGLVVIMNVLGFFHMFLQIKVI